jgi:ABC-type sugar transport system permease subunit
MFVSSVAARSEETEGRPPGRRMRLTREEHKRLARRARLRRELTAWGFLCPQFLFFVVFLLVPCLGVLFWSVQSGGIEGDSQFVGLNNFLRLPNNVEASAAVTNTFAFALMSVPLIVVISLGLGLLLARVRRGASAYRFLLYLPVLIPAVIVGLIWIYLTHQDFGLFNETLRMFGIAPVTWLGPKTALPVLAAVDVWRNVGYWAIFFLAAIIGLPEELYQAAALDGAGSWARFRHLTLPLLRRIILFAVVISTIVGLQVFDTVYIMTGGTTSGAPLSTITIVYKVWSYAFRSDRIGYAAAISLVLLVAILGLTVVQMRLLRNRRGGN